MRVVRETLADLDLVYSAGLYDYLPSPVASAPDARALRAAPARRALAGLGNLVESPDITWVMDYVLGWPLVYRTDESMLRLAERSCAGAVEGAESRGTRRGTASSWTSRALLQIDARASRRVAGLPTLPPFAGDPRDARIEGSVDHDGGGRRTAALSRDEGRVAEGPRAGERCTRRAPARAPPPVLIAAPQDPSRARA